MHESTVRPMSRYIEEKACAKLNLSLDVLGTLSDGYHEMRMVMQSVDLFDRVRLELTNTRQIRVRTNLHFLPSDGRNIAVKAAAAFFERSDIKDLGVDISLKKRIPVCAGMGGGSSDAAAVLRGLNTLTGAGFTCAQLEDIGRSLGSDVPFCVCGGTQLATGKGDELQPLPAMPDCHIVICKPRFSISTPELFKLIDARRSRIHPDTDGMIASIAAGDICGVGRRLYNVFEDVLPPKYSSIAAAKNQLLDMGAIGAVMTGTGSALFGIFQDSAAAVRARDALAPRFKECFLAHPKSRYME